MMPHDRPGSRSVDDQRALLGLAAEAANAAWHAWRYPLANRTAGAREHVPPPDLQAQGVAEREARAEAAWADALARDPRWRL